MDDEFLDEVDKTADISFNASAPTDTDASAPANCNSDTITCPVVLNLLAKPLFAARRSGITTTGFLDGERKPGGVTPTTRPPYLGPPSGRAPSDEDKRGAYHLYAEYIAGRLGKNDEENSRNWNTVLWIDKHYRVTTTPAEALPPLNIYVGDKLSQSTEGTGTPTGPDDEAPDKAGNEGVEFESIHVGEADGQSSMCVMDETGTTRRLDIKTNDNDLLRLIDALNEVDDFAKIDVNDLRRNGPPLLPQVDFPSDNQRAESGKIIRIVMMGLRTLWHPVIRSIADHATMTSLAQGNRKEVAAAVGRQRVIEGLRLAESIRKGLKKQPIRKGLTGRERSFSMWLNQIRARQTTVNRPGFSVDDTIKGTLAVLADKSLPTPVRTEGHYWPVFKLADNPLPANENHRFDAFALRAA